MQFREGKCVVYRSSEICRIMGVESRCLDGVNQREYCILCPINSAGSTYYVPLDCAEDKLRELLTKEQVLGLIDGMRNAEAEWCDDGNERKARQNEILSGSNYSKIIGMTRSLHSEKEKRSAQGKKLLAADERAMKAAETLINREFGYVLGIEENKVGEFIKERLGEA